MPNHEFTWVAMLRAWQQGNWILIDRWVNSIGISNTPSPIKNEAWVDGTMGGSHSTTNRAKWAKLKALWLLRHGGTKKRNKKKENFHNHDLMANYIIPCVTLTCAYIWTHNESSPTRMTQTAFRDHHCFDNGIPQCISWWRCHFG